MAPVKLSGPKTTGVKHAPSPAAVSVSASPAAGHVPLQQWPCVHFIQLPDYRVQTASPNIEELTGLAPAEWCAATTPFWNVVHQSDAPALREEIEQAARTHAVLTKTYRIRHAHTGRVSYIMEQRRPVTDAKGKLVSHEVSWVDVTRRTIAERRLSAAAWKQTLGVLTLGLAHDFKNVMAGIHGLNESFLAESPPDHSFYESALLIKKSSLQAIQLVERMISLHVGQAGESNYHDLNEVARDVVDFVGKVLPRRVQLATHLCESQLPVYVDLVEFRQVLINLMLNGADAMPRGGRLTVQTSRHLELPAMKNIHGVAPRVPALCLSVQDTGIGIKPGLLSSIFDPFFTTKIKGSGLGLYNAKLAVEKMHGAIAVSSIQGVGTTFQIWLPEADFSEGTQAQARAAHATRRSLLVIGQPGEVLEKTSELLRTQNYYVVMAESSARLSELLRSSDDVFDCVLILAEPIDVTTGWLPSELKREYKNIKLVVKLTGGNPDEMDGQAQENADLLLGAELSETDFLTKLKDFLNRAE